VIFNFFPLGKLFPIRVIISFSKENKMKLIFCPKCQNIKKLSGTSTSSCECGASQGRLDNNTATTYGVAVLIGFEDTALLEAVDSRYESIWGSEFTATVFPLRAL